MKRTTNKKIIAWILTLITILVSIPLDFLTCFNNKAYAASNYTYKNTTIISGSAVIPYNINSKVFNAGIPLLGTVYSGGYPSSMNLLTPIQYNVNGANSTKQTYYKNVPTSSTISNARQPWKWSYACDTFVSSMLLGANFTRVPEVVYGSTYNSWDYLVKNGKLQHSRNGETQLRYNGKNVKTVVCGTLEDYAHAIDDPQYAGCAIILSAATRYNDILDKDISILREGTVGIGYRKDDKNTAAHVFYLLGSYGTRKSGDMWSYASSTLTALQNKYPNLKTRKFYQLAANQGLISNNAYLWQGGNGNNASKTTWDNVIAATKAVAKFNMSATATMSNSDTVNSKLQANYNYPRISNWATNSTVWAMDTGTDGTKDGTSATWSEDIAISAGGRLTTIEEGDSNEGKAIYWVRLMYLKPNNNYYASATLNKVSTSSNSIYPGNAVYALFDGADTGSHASDTQVRDFARYVANNCSSASDAIAYSNGRDFGQVLSSLRGYFKTNSDGSVSNLVDRSNNSLVLDFEGITSRDFRLVEIYPANGYKRDDNVYSFTLTSSNTSNNLTDALNGTKISNLEISTQGTNSNTTTNDDNMSYAGNTTSSSLVFKLKDTPKYSSKIGIKKVASSDGTTVVGGATYAISTNINHAITGAKSGGTANAVSTATSPTSGVSYFAVQTHDSSSNVTYYMWEASAPSGYARNKGLWKIVVTPVSNATGSGTKITSVRYFNASQVTSNTANTLSTTTSIGTSLRTTVKSGIQGYYTATVSNSGGYVTAGEDEVKAEFKLEFHKVDQNGSYLGGATFKYGTFTSNKVTSADTAISNAVANLSSSSHTVTTDSTQVFGGNPNAYGDTWDSGTTKLIEGTTYYRARIYYETGVPANYSGHKNIAILALTSCVAATNPTPKVQYYYYKTTSGDINVNNLPTTLSGWTIIPTSAKSPSTAVEGLYVAAGTDSVNAVYLTNTTYYGRVRVRKVDASTNAMVAGATYNICTSEAQAKDIAANGNSSTYNPNPLVTENNTSVWKDFNFSSDSNKTYWVAERIAPSGYDRNTGYWKVIITAANSYSNSTIVSATYYPNNYAGLGTTPIAVPSSDHKDSTLITLGWITSNNKDLAVPDQKWKLQFGVGKVILPSGSRVGGAEFTVFNNVEAARYAASNGKVGSYTSNVVDTLTTLAGEGVYHKESNLSSSGNVTFYIAETKAPTGSTRNTGYWRITVNKVLMNADDTDSRIQSATYYTYNGSSWVSTNLGNTFVTDSLVGYISSYGNLIAPNFQNSTSINVQLHATKMLVGDTLKANQFEFILTNTVHPNNTTAKATQTKTNVANGTISFDPITFIHDQNIKEEGTWKFTITENAKNEAGIIYDTKTITATVVVTYNSSTNTMTTTTSYDNSTTFVNVITRYYTFPLVKTSLSGQLVSGATFQVYTDSGLTYLHDTLTPTTRPDTMKVYRKSGESAKTHTFYVIESAAPNGFVKNTGIWAVTMTGGVLANGSDSTITSVKYYPYGSISGTPVNVTSAFNGTYYNNTNNRGRLDGRTLNVIEVEAYEAQFKLYKYDKSAGTSRSNEPVEGITFKVYGTYDDAIADANPLYTENTDETGYATFNIDTWYNYNNPRTRDFYVREFIEGNTYVNGTQVYLKAINNVCKVTVTGKPINTNEKTLVSIEELDSSTDNFILDDSGDIAVIHIGNAEEELYGALGVYKYVVINNEMVPVEDVVFSIYEDPECTQFIDNLITNADGTAYKTVQSLINNDAWYKTDGLTKTFYIRETDNSNAKVNGVSRVLDAPESFVITATVTGVTENQSFVGKTSYDCDDSSIGLKTIDIEDVTLSAFTLNNTVSEYISAIGAYKTDSNNNRISGLVFNIYDRNTTFTDGVANKAPIATMVTNSRGIARLDITNLTNGYASSSVWNVGDFREFKIQEDKESCYNHNLTWDSRVIIATAELVDKTSASFNTSYSIEGSTDTVATTTYNYSYNGRTLPLTVYRQVNKPTVDYTVNKQFKYVDNTNYDTSNISLLTVALYDTNNHMITEDAYGNPITNPVNINTTNWTYTWTHLSSDVEYKVVETALTFKTLSEDAPGEVREVTVELNSEDLIKQYFDTKQAVSESGNTKTITLTNTYKLYHYNLFLSKLVLKSDNTNDAYLSDDVYDAKFRLYTDPSCTIPFSEEFTLTNEVDDDDNPTCVPVITNYVSTQSSFTLYLKETEAPENTKLNEGYWEIILNGSNNPTVINPNTVNYYDSNGVLKGTVKNLDQSSIADITNVYAATRGLNRVAVLNNDSKIIYGYQYDIVNVENANLYGAIGLVKSDELGNIISNDNATFALYKLSDFSNGTVSGNAIISFTTSQGYAFVDVSTISDGVIAEGDWTEVDGTTKTFILVETAAPSIEYQMTNDIWKVVVEGSDDIDNSTTTYYKWSNNDWVLIPTNSTIYTQSTLASSTLVADTASIVNDMPFADDTTSKSVMTVVNKRIAHATVTKNWNNGVWDSDVVSITVALYDQNGNKVTKDINGNTIDNITLTAQNPTYTWNNLPYSDGTTVYSYNAKEIGLVVIVRDIFGNTSNQTISSGNVSKFMGVTYTNTTGNIVEDNISKYYSSTIITNTPKKWQGYYGIYKSDEDGIGVNAVFNVYADPECTQLIVENLTTTEQTPTVTRSTGIYWNQQNTWTYYIKEISNDNSHLLYPFVIKATVERTTSSYRTYYEIERGDYTQEEIDSICAQYGISTEVMNDDYANLAYVINSTRELEISKVDEESNEEIVGATLTVYVAEEVTEIPANVDVYTYNDKTYIKGNVLRINDTDITWVSTNEPHVVKNIEAGIYILEETVSPSTYITAESVIFEVKSDMKRTSVVMQDKPTETYFEKVSEDGINLAGATIELVDENEVVVLSFTTGNDDVTINEDYAAFGTTTSAEIVDNIWRLTVKYLPKGEYTWKETAAPDGFMFADDIRISISDTTDEELSRMIDYYYLYINKLDFVTNATVIDATLTIYKFDDTKPNNLGAKFTSWTTQSGVDSKRIDNIPDGKYVLVESATANGYCTAEDIVFEITENDRKAQVIKTVTMKDKPLSTEISKTDITTGKFVEGATLRLITLQDIVWVHPDGSNEGITETFEANELVREWVTTAENGTLVLDYLPVGSYRLVEIQAPTKDGYKLAEDVIFTVSNDKSLDVNGATKVTSKVNMKDAATQVRFKKLNTDGETVSGTKYEIHKATFNDAGEITGFEEAVFSYRLPLSAMAGNATIGELVTCAWTSTDDWKVFNYIPEGSYYLVEVDAPDGYSLGADRLFTVTGDLDENTISVTQVDAKLTRLPDTGGIGTNYFTMFGFMFMLCGTTLLYYKKKRNY